MIDIVIYVIVLNIIFELLQVVYPFSKLTSFIRSAISVLALYLICLKIKSIF